MVSTLLVLMVVGAWVTPVSIAAGSVLRQTFEFEGNVAAKIVVHLPRPARLFITMSWQGPAEDFDVAKYDLYRTWPSGDFLRSVYSVGSQGGLLEVDTNLLGIDASLVPDQLRVSAVGRSLEAPLLDQDPWYTRGSGVDPMDAGDWSIVVMGGFSQRVERTRIELEIGDAEAQTSWEFTPHVALLTQRDLDDSGAHALGRTLGLGATVAVGASKTISLEKGLVGFSWYLSNALVDHHSYIIDGPFGQKNGDFQEFPGEPSGEYSVRLDQVSLGDWPGRAYFLYGDMS